MQNYIRWTGPKTPPPYKNKATVPELLDELLDVFLPSSLPKESKLAERNAIANFINELNVVSGRMMMMMEMKIRRKTIPN